jgi:hypothetical protein
VVAEYRHEDDASPKIDRANALRLLISHSQSRKIRIAHPSTLNPSFMAAQRLFEREHNDLKAFEVTSAC